MKFLSLAALAFAAFPVWVFAATLTIDPPSGTFGPGDSFVATVRIDTDSPEECVNAVDALIEYPKDLVKPVAISKGESLISLWAEEPSFSSESGTVRIQGGIPGGYCGRVVGDPGRTNVIAKIVFTVPATQIGAAAPETAVRVPVRFLPASVVLLNDGAGTPASLRLEGAEYVRALEPVGSSNEWLTTIREDLFPPEEFRAEIVRDPNIHAGKFVLVFSTVDKQSGLSHYEVTEEDPIARGMKLGGRAPAVAVRASSPYLLEDQSLKSRIIVRAVDHAGNRREFVIEPTDASAKQQASSVFAGQAIVWGVVSILVVFFALLLGNVLRRRRIADADTHLDDRVSPPSQ